MGYRPEPKRGASGVRRAGPEIPRWRSESPPTHTAGSSV